MDRKITNMSFTAKNLKALSSNSVNMINISKLTEKYINIVMDHAHISARQGRYETSIMILESDSGMNKVIAHNILEFLTAREYKATLIEDDKVCIIEFSW